MLAQNYKKKIRSKLNNIYKRSLPKNDIYKFEDEIIQIIKNFNKKNSKRKKHISEKTSLIICYGDSIYLSKKNSIPLFKTFFMSGFIFHLNLGTVILTSIIFEFTKVCLR